VAAVDVVRQRRHCDHRPRLDEGKGGSVVSYKIGGWPALDAGTQRAQSSKARVLPVRRTIFLSLAIPILLFTLLVAIDLGRLFTGYVQMSNAVHDGVALAAQGPTATANINDIVFLHEPIGTSSTTLAITCTNGICANARSGEAVTLTATWTYKPITAKLLAPIWDVEPVVLSAQATMTVL